MYSQNNQSFQAYSFDWMENKTRVLYWHPFSLSVLLAQAWEFVWENGGRFIGQQLFLSERANPSAARQVVAQGSISQGLLVRIWIDHL